MFKNLGSKLAYLIIGILLAIAGTAYAVSVSVPAATQLGDLPTGKTTGNYQLLHPGADLTVLTASSTAPNGIAWQTASGSSASLLGGSNGKNAYWTGPITLGASGDLFDNGTVVGVNATSSTINFNIQGTGTLNPFNVASSSGTSYLQVLANGAITMANTLTINAGYPGGLVVTGLSDLQNGIENTSSNNGGQVYIADSLGVANTVNLTSLSTSQLVGTDGSKNLISIALPLSVANGGIGTTTLGNLSLGSNLSFTAGDGKLSIIGTSTQISLGANVVTALATGTTGNIFNGSISSNTVTLNLPFASGSNTGQLQSGDWTTFNNKQSVLTFPLSYASSTATTTNTIWVDGNRGDSYTANGSIVYPYKTVSAMLGASALGSGNAFNLSPGTYVDGAPDTFPTTPFYISGNESTYVPVSGVTFPGSFDIYDLGIQSCGGAGVTESDNSLSFIHQFNNGTIGCNLTLAGLATLQGMALTNSTTALTILPGSLTNVAATLVYPQVNIYGTFNLNDDQVQASTTKYALVATTTGSQINILGATIIQTGNGGAINFANGATSSPNFITNFSVLSNTTSPAGGINLGNAATQLCTYYASNLAGSILYAQGTNFLPCINGALTVQATTSLLGTVSIASSTTIGATLGVTGTSTLATTSIVGTLSVTGIPTLSGISNCNGSQFLQITSGLFGCGTPAAGGGSSGGGWATSSPYYITNTFGTSVGINSSTPIANLSVEGISGSTTPEFVVASSTRQIIFQVSPATGAINNSTGKLVINPQNSGDVDSTAALEIDDSSNGQNSDFGFKIVNPNTNADTAWFMAKASGTPSSLATITTGNSVIGSIEGYSWATSWHPITEIRSVIDGNINTNSFPGKIQFFTTATGSTSTTLRMTISNQGNINIATLTTSSLVKTDANNNLQSTVLGTGLSFSGTTLNASNAFTGTGINGQNAYWTSSTALTSSSDLLNNGTVVGINATSSNVALFIQGISGSASSTLIVASSSGANLFSVSSNGNVGVNTNTPSQTLTLQGSGTQDIFNVVATSGLSSLYVASNGNVGIGTTSPSQLLTVGNNNQFTVDSSGNVISAGNVTLGSGKTVFTDNLRDVSGAINIIGGGVTQLYVSGTRVDLLGGSSNVVGGNFTNSNAAFTTRSSSATGTFNSLEVQKQDGTDIAVFQQNGNVGIGTTTPSYSLHVVGQGSISPFAIASSTGSQLFSVNSNGSTTLSSLGTGCVGAASGSLYIANSSGCSTGGGSGNSAFTIGNALIYNATSTDSVGIGTSTPQQTLSVVGSGSKTPFNVASSSGANLFSVSSNGNVGIGTTTPNFQLTSTGTVQFKGLSASASNQTDYVCLDANGQLISDSTICVSVSAQRFKQSINPLENALAETMQFSPKSFYYKPDAPGFVAGLQYGLIADDVQKIDPNLVTTETATTTFEGKTYPPGTVEGLVAPNNWIGLLVSDIQQQQYEIKNITVGKVKRSAEENWQWIAIGLLTLGFIFQQFQISKLKKKL